MESNGGVVEAKKGRRTLTGEKAEEGNKKGGGVIPKKKKPVNCNWVNCLNGKKWRKGVVRKKGVGAMAEKKKGGGVGGANIAWGKKRKGMFYVLKKRGLEKKRGDNLWPGGGEKL